MCVPSTEIFCPSLLSVLFGQPLRQQTASVSVENFTNKVEKAQAKARKKEKKKIKKALPHASKFKAADLDKYVHDLFAIGDTNGDGVLEPRELKKLLQMSGFKLSAKEIHTFVQQADTNNDGVIEYREFAPVMSAMLQLSEKPKVNWPALAAVVITALVRLGAGQKGKEGQEIKEEEA